jgi:hypothetical protein
MVIGVVLATLEVLLHPSPVIKAALLPNGGYLQEPAPTDRHGARFRGPAGLRARGQPRRERPAGHLDRVWPDTGPAVKSLDGME